MQQVERIEFDTFEWDEAKRLLTIDKSGLAFRVVASALLQPHLETPSPRDGEMRTKAICRFFDRIIVVIHTDRGDACRIISAWPADKNEQRKYREIFGG